MTPMHNLFNYYSFDFSFPPEVVVTYFYSFIFDQYRFLTKFFIFQHSISIEKKKNGQILPFLVL